MHLQISTILLLFIFCLVATTYAKNDHFFECVDIYKQSSLQHPLLKHHKLQITSLEPTRRSSSTICPSGMVPIHKFRNNFTNFIERDAANWATLDTKTVSKKYHGAKVVSSIHNPTSFSGKVSKAQVWIQSGSPQEINCIQFGWAIHSELYGDKLTHFTTYWTSDGYKKTGCYNTVCQGFIQDFSDLYPGKPYEEVSTYGGQQDGPTGNWMLTNNGGLVGYWPKEIFTSLRLRADSIRYGGVTVGGAPMGNGKFPDSGNDLSRSSYFKDIKFVDANLQSNPIIELQMNVNAPKPNCYKLNYLRDLQIITYGGPGGDSCPN